MRLSCALFSSLLLCSAASAVTIDWVVVGDPGTALVDHAYRISKHEVTNAQYTEFLNAVGAEDSKGLYHPWMTEVERLGGIARSGDPGSYTYQTIAGREDLPVEFVSFWDAVRFSNWLHNGQAAGAQDQSTTEHGAYTITDHGISENSITRNQGALIFVPSADEWRKAAYWNSASSSYRQFPAGSNSEITCSAPTSSPNSANCERVVDDFTPVGSYAGSPSPYGTFDQGGNAWEWNETIIDGTHRQIRGGSYRTNNSILRLTQSDDGAPALEVQGLGFRVAAIIPEPATALLVAGGLLGIAGWRRTQRQKDARRENDRWSGASRLSGHESFRCPGRQGTKRVRLAHMRQVRRQSGS